MAGPQLDLRGYRGFIPYREIEDGIEKLGELLVAVDLEAEPLIEAWARARGLTVARTGDNMLKLLRRGPARPRRGESAPASPAPRLWIDHGSWNKRLSEQLADISYVMNNVIQAPVIYRGHPTGFDYGKLRARSVLLRVTLPDSDYFLAVRSGRIVAAAQLGKPLSSSQAENILGTLLSHKEALLTVYDTGEIA